MTRMGRPRKENKKERVLAIRITKDDIESLRDICKKEKTSPANIIRDFIKEKVLPRDTIPHQISKIIEKLMKEYGIITCMVVHERDEGIEGIMPLTDEVKKELMASWETLRDLLKKCLQIIKNFSEYGLYSLNFEFGRYKVFFYVVSETDMALVAIATNNINERIIKQKLEKARAEIVKIIKI